MTIRNMKNKATQRGGLMLEALAMLGLIAVVTPTMYKKSAERTLEVEDINTADTIRTYTKAVEAYMSENSATIIANMEAPTTTGNDRIVKVVSASDLAAYLPYKFDTSKQLYDYNTPVIRLYKNGSNLTSFILFPAKENAENGIGQERTSRIAALIGSSGGYMTSSNTARGVGGVWSLTSGDYGTIFGSTAANQYSLVTSSSNVISGNSEAGLDNAKYLQRTYEGEGEEWRNAMRTDLYLGGYKTDDEYPEDHPTDATLHSIRNVNSLIIGAEKTVEEESGTTSNYGLYISEDSAKPDTFLAGTLTAAAQNLFVDSSNLKYGELKDTEGNLTGYGFSVTNAGDMTNVGNVDLGKNFASTPGGYINLGNGTVMTAENSQDMTNVQINFMKYNYDKSVLSMNNETETFTEAGRSGSYIGKVKIMDGGYQSISKRTYNSSNGTSSVSYFDAPSWGDNYMKANYFPVEVGSNMKVDGLLAARQIDTQNIRMAELEAGSKNIDDAEKWLKVDETGIVVKTTPQQLANNAANRTEIVANKDRILLHKARDNSEADVDISKPSYMGAYIDMTADSPSSALMQMGADEIKLTAHDEISLRTNGIRTRQKQNELLIGAGYYEDTLPKDYDHNHRTKFEDGHVDFVGSNLHVVNDKGQNILSVLGNKKLEAGFKDTAGEKNNYKDVLYKMNASETEVIDYPTSKTDNSESIHLAAHGNVEFTSINQSVNDTSDTSVHYLTMGVDDTRAAVNIARGEEVNTAANNKRVMFVDLSSTKSGVNNAYVANPGTSATSTLATDDGGNLYGKITDGVKKSYTMDPGTIYVRKGLLEVVPDKGMVAADDTTRTTNAYSANTGKGIIRASRFVANNVDASGNFVKVPELFTSSTYSQYNGSNTRYDTYMVNPAYTSVMNDIKLVSRGGARLSDVLPDFITKAIYVVNNDYDDKKSNLKFKLNDKGTEVENAPGKTSFTWASPYSGVVPAPQCPPGYARVITVTPTGIRMAQAGEIGRTVENNVHGKRDLYVREYANKDALNAVMNDEKFQTSEFNITDYVPEYGRSQLTTDETDEEMLLQLENQGDESATSTYTVKGAGNVYTQVNVAGNYLPYVLGVKNQSTAHPLTFQQSTWLKALSVPVNSTTDRWYDDENNKADTSGGTTYNRAWAVLLGFVYPVTEYCAIAKEVGYDNYEGACNENDGSYDGSHNITYSSGNDYYWNLFPVKKTSIEAYATTYCYFDRTNIYNMYGSDYGKHIDTYNTAKATIAGDPGSSSSTGLPVSFVKVGGSEDVEYRMNLNDPTMKYNELW